MESHKADGGFPKRDWVKACVSEFGLPMELDSEDNILCLCPKCLKDKARAIYIECKGRNGTFTSMLFSCLNCQRNSIKESLSYATDTAPIKPSCATDTAPSKDGFFASRSPKTTFHAFTKLLFTSGHKWDDIPVPGDDTPTIVHKYDDEDRITTLKKRLDEIDAVMDEVLEILLAEGKKIKRRNGKPDLAKNTPDYSLEELYEDEIKGQ